MYVGVFCQYHPTPHAPEPQPSPHRPRIGLELPCCHLLPRRQHRDCCRCFTTMQPVDCTRLIPWLPPSPAPSRQIRPYSKAFRPWNALEWPLCPWIPSLGVSYSKAVPLECPLGIACRPWIPSLGMANSKAAPLEWMLGTMHSKAWNAGFPLECGLELTARSFGTCFGMQPREHGFNPRD